MKINRLWLQELRLAMKKTHQDVADESGIERAYYTMIENGARTPSPTVAQKIAGSLNFDWTIFFTNKSGTTTLKETEQKVG
jgi:putative transcriptional regulator